MSPLLEATLYVATVNSRLRSRDEFELALQVPLQHAILKPMISELTTDMMDELDYLDNPAEIAGMESKVKAMIGNVSKMRLDAPEILGTIFSMLDRDGSGFIEKKEWSAAVRMLDAWDQGDESVEMIGKLYECAFDLLDVDGSGAVNFADFLLLMKSAVKAGLKMMEKMVELGRPLSSAFVESMMKNGFLTIREDLEFDKNVPLRFENIYEYSKKEGVVEEYLSETEEMRESYKDAKEEIFAGMAEMLPGYKQFEIM